ncbi:MAG: hypothetical protein ACRCWF_05555 [Beijerinckiaceae bacterium]
MAVTRTLATIMCIAGIDPMLPVLLIYIGVRQAVWTLKEWMA